MKLTNLMLSAFAAVVAFVACNKEDIAPEAKRLRTVEISLEKDLTFLFSYDLL